MNRLLQSSLFIGISIFFLACGHTVPKFEGSYDRFQDQYGYLTLKNSKDSLLSYAKLRLPEISEDDFWSSVQNERDLATKWVLLLAWQKRYGTQDSLLNLRIPETHGWQDSSQDVHSWLIRKFNKTQSSVRNEQTLKTSSSSTLSISSSSSISTLDTLSKINKSFCKKYYDSLWLSAFELEQQESYDSSLVAYNFYLNQTDTLSILCQQANFLDKEERKGIAWFRKGYTLKKAGYDSLFLKWFDTSTVAKQSLTYKGAARMLLSDYYESLGDSSQQKLFIKQSLLDHPINYYGWLARHHLKAPLPQKSNSATPWNKIPTCPSNTPNIHTLYKISLVLGLNDLAEDFLKKWVCVSPIVQMPYAQDALKYGNPALAYKLARGFVDQSLPRQQLDQLSDSLLQIYFPTPYKDIVLSAAKEFEIDSFFIWSIMRQESTFDPQIKSPVGATGLLQLMPATARTLATELQISEWQDSLLTNPQYNIRLGAYYLSQLQKKYGDSTWAIAHYNAGPKPVARWRELESRKSLTKPYTIEEISFKETRDYVKKVLANWWNYQAFYRNQNP